MSQIVPCCFLSRRRASHGADARRYLSLSWRAPMREPEEEKAPIGVPLSDLSFDQFMDIEDQPVLYKRV